jgi:protein-S-isoprenylcysteine O-methyltransferase Ste14
MRHSDGSIVSLSTARPEDWLAQITRSAAYDIAIKAIFFLWYLFIAHQVVRQLLISLAQPEVLASPALFLSSVVSRGTLLLFFFTLVLFTMLRSRPIAKAPGLTPRITALTGTFLLMALPSFPHRQLSVEMNIVSSIIILAGNCLAAYVIFRLGRSISIMAEARKLVTKGPYGVIRHPLYLAEEVAVIGIFLQYASPWTALLVAAHWLLQMARMRNEERVLCATFPDYRGYMERTARILPGIY